MNGFLLLIPFLLIRFGLLSMVDKNAVQRAAHFAPMYGKEKIAYWIYQLSNIGMFLYLLLLKVEIESGFWSVGGLICYCSGLVLCAVSIVHFASPSEKGLNTKGIYRLSRNPMYIAYFICFIGMAALTRSWVLLGIILIFQISSHWIILAEERECIQRFGEPYAEYVKTVKRYI